MKDKEYKWPTREEWAVQRRTVYYDMLEDLISTKLSDYASGDEVAAAIAALRKIWCAYGRQMKEAKRIAGEVVNRNYYDLSEEEQKLMKPIWDCQRRRLEINRVIKHLGEGQFNWGYAKWVLERDDCPPLTIIKERYDAAHAAAELKMRQRVAATPIDDDAWVKELEWRRRFDAGDNITVIQMGKHWERAMRWQDNFAGLFLEATTHDGDYAVLDLARLDYSSGYGARYAPPHRRSERPDWVSLGEFRTIEAACRRCEEHFSGESYTPLAAA